MTSLKELHPYQLVILDCPYDTWDSQMTRELFVEVVGLKLKGYLMSYPYGTLPVDTNDFVGTHHLICEMRKKHLVPVMGYKSITLSRCKQHQLTFPPLAFLHAVGAVEHLEEVKKIMELAAKQNHEIAYDGSWAMDPEIRKDKAKSEHLKQIMAAINVLYHENYNIPEIIGIGVPKFKTDQYFEGLGYQRIQRGGNPLSPFITPVIPNENTVIMHLKQFSDQAIASARRFQSLWTNRLEISDPTASNRMGAKKVAA